MNVPSKRRAAAANEAFKSVTKDYVVAGFKSYVAMDERGFIGIGPTVKKAMNAKTFAPGVMKPEVVYQAGKAVKSESSIADLSRSAAGRK